MTSTDTLALYERILALVNPEELHLSCNAVLQDEIATVQKAVDDIVATFAKVEEVREAVNQLEQGKGPTGRSESLMKAMDSTLELQEELEAKLNKLAAGMKVGEEETKVRKRRDEVKQKKKENGDSASETSSSSSEEEEPKEKKQKKEKKTEKGSADLHVAHDCLKVMIKVKTADKKIQVDMENQWKKALVNIQQFLKLQAKCDTHTTDYPAAEVTARALEFAAIAFKKVELAGERAKEIQSLIAALKNACSKNELLTVFFHRVRAQLESLEMGLSTSNPAVSGQKSKKKSLEQQIKLSGANTLKSPTTTSKSTSAAMGRLTAILTELDQWQDGIFSLDQLDKMIKTVNGVVTFKSKEWNPLADPAVHTCVEKLRDCIKLIQKQTHRDKRLQKVNKWRSSIEQYQ